MLILIAISEDKLVKKPSWSSTSILTQICISSLSFSIYCLLLTKEHANSSQTGRNPILLIGYFEALRILFCLYKGSIKSLAFGRDPISTNCLQQTDEGNRLSFPKPVLHSVLIRTLWLPLTIIQSLPCSPKWETAKRHLSHQSSHRWQTTLT